MKLADFIGSLSLLDPDASLKILERRIELLAQYKLLNLTYSNDDKIDEVALPVAL